MTFQNWLMISPILLILFAAALLMPSVMRDRNKYSLMAAANERWENSTSQDEKHGESEIKNETPFEEEKAYADSSILSPSQMEEVMIGSVTDLTQALAFSRDHEKFFKHDLSYPRFGSNEIYNIRSKLKRERLIHRAGGSGHLSAQDLEALAEILKSVNVQIATQHNFEPIKTLTYLTKTSSTDEHYHSGETKLS